MKSQVKILLMTILLGACVTSSRTHDPEQQALSWDTTCQPANLLARWVILTCTMTNRTEQPLAFEAIDSITSQNEAWRQPSAEELAYLKGELVNQKSRKTLPLILNGGDRLEGFIAQMVVVSGLWLTQSVKDPIQLPEKTEKTVEVQPGKSVRQAFILTKNSSTSPSYVTLKSADGRFEKQVHFVPEARQRVTTPPSPAKKP
ncbi:hypothetical protein [Oligoflexus tunisiensis]|uniref:hypothetical protein n=1 Tax=Oligoflexus tunisiensis TaxID=708132 RepID=UPI00114CDF47|nr:hypothetical protein [Oligoflexus tunisiensis]